MRFLTWNIKQGGGARIPEICRHIGEVGAELVALTEFQAPNETVLRDGLHRLGYRFVVTSKPNDRSNGLLVAARRPLRPSPDAPTPEIDRERWLALRVEDLELDVLVVHIPGTPDNKFTNGYGISGTRRKELLWEHTIGFAEKHRDGNAVLLGDFNTGFRMDTEGEMFKLSGCMQRLLDAGYVDTWRHRHPEGRDYTWYSKRRDKTTGIAEDFNGFRLDYVFVSAGLLDAIDDCAILHAPRTAGISDHASLVADIGLGHDAPDGITAQSEIITPPTPPAVQRTRRVRANAVPPPATIPARRDPHRRVRIDLSPGSLPDMTCGLNGQPFQQEFRPTYITAVWTGSALTELRIWGPRVLNDGSLGKRELDHVWTASRPVGVSYGDLPAAVVELLRPHERHGPTTALDPH